MNNWNGTILYHGSYAVVESPDLNQCREGKDFGKGFYLTTSEEQARRFCKTAVGKAQKNGISIDDPPLGYVSKYVFHMNDKLKIYEFDSADAVWLHSVVGHRKKGLFSKEIEKYESYDIMIGKIANDNTNQVITTYMSGLYGEIGSLQADNFAIGLLLPEKLKDQICFRTEKSFEFLEFISSETVSI